MPEKIDKKSFIFGIIATIIALVIWYGIDYYILTDESEVKLIITNRYAKATFDKIIDLYGEGKITQWWTPDTDDFFSLYVSAEGDTNVFVNNIEFFLDRIDLTPIDDRGQIGKGLWVDVVGARQFKLEGGETKEVSLRFTFDNDYWNNTNVNENSKISARADVTVYYKTRNKEKIAEIHPIFPISIRQWGGLKKK